MNKNLIRIIKEIANNLNIECHILSEGWIAQLKKEQKYRYIVGFKFDLNTQATSQLCDDKYALYSIFKNHNIPIIEHKILYNESTMKLYLNDESTKQQAYNYFNEHRKDVVLKANIGTCGNQVYHITTLDNLDKVMDKLFINNNTISICPFYPIKHEYRLIYLNGNCELIYGKIRPIVTGDGHKNLITLLKEFNPFYFSKANILDNFNYKEDYVPKKGEIIEYNWQFNLSRGANVFLDIDENLKKRLIDLALKAANVINLRFGSIDIIEDTNGNLLVLEINSGVMMENICHLLPDGERIAYNIYEKAIKAMFE